MKVIFSIVLLLISVTTRSQHQSLGLRLGEPTGISYKRYITNSSNTIEVGIGWVQRGWNNRYYRKSFRNYSQFDADNYVAHTVENNFYVQGRFLKHYPWQVEGIEGDVEWYWGVGVLLKAARVNYRYEDTNAVPILESDTVTDVDLGPEVPFGMEYTFEDVPLTLFGEISLFIEVMNRSGIPSVNGALGIRYNFFGNQ